MPNMVHLAVGDLLIAVHRAEPPTDDEWAAYTQSVRQIDKDRLRTLIFTDGGAPTGAQRERLNEALEGKPALTAVISSSSMVRGVVNAINGSINSKIKAFSPEAARQAFHHLGTRDPDEIEAMWKIVGNLRAKLAAELLQELDRPREAMGSRPELITEGSAIDARPREHAGCGADSR